MSMDGRSIVWKGLGEVGGSSKKKGRLPNPYQSVHRTTHSSDQPKTQRVVDSRYRRQANPAAEQWTAAPQLSTSPNQFYSGSSRSIWPMGHDCGATTKFCQKDWICRACSGWCCAPSTSERQLALCSASSDQQQQRSELAPTASRTAHCPPTTGQTDHHRQSRRKKDLDLRPSSTTTQPTRPTNPQPPAKDLFRRHPPANLVESIHSTVPSMSDNGEIEVEAVSGYQVLPKDVVQEIGSVKLFNKWSYEDVEIRDISLT